MAGVAFNLSDCSRQEGANSARLPASPAHSLTCNTIPKRPLYWNTFKITLFSKYIWSDTFQECTALHRLILLTRFSSAPNYLDANKWFHRCLLLACLSICIYACICIFFRPIIEVLINGAPYTACLQCIWRHLKIFHIPVSMNYSLVR